MKGEPEKKIVRRIRVNVDKCVGCRSCQVACSAFHANPKYSSVNPARSRIRMMINHRSDEYVPIRATDYTKAACDGRRVYMIKGNEYSDCSFCGSICPARDLFKEPGSGLPLKCDMCEADPPVEPMCVQACPPKALTYEEVEGEVVSEEEKSDEVALGLKSLLDRHGYEQLADTFARISQKK